MGFLTFLGWINDYTDATETTKNMVEVSVFTVYISPCTQVVATSSLCETSKIQVASPYTSIWTSIY